jgi:hypothetical protein
MRFSSQLTLPEVHEDSSREPRQFVSVVFSPTRARSQEHEPPASAFNRALDLIQERRDALHFLEHDNLIGTQRPQLQPEQ